MTRQTAAIAKSVLLGIILAATLHARAQDWKTEQRFNVLFGLNQLLVVHGFNVEANYIHGRFIFDYSHGVSLEFKDANVPQELRTQGVAVHMPYTTGFGIGYRLTEWLNLRVEPKFHRFEFRYEEEQKYGSSEITAYNTFSLGLGLYGAYRPFKHSKDFLKGILISPSVRFWPTIASSTGGHDFSYYNLHTGAHATIKTYDPGVNLTPLIINVSVGYSFPLKAKK